MTDRNVPATAWGVLRQSGLVPQFLVLSFAVWLHAANSLLAATTLPRAVDELGGANLISWAFTLYLLGSILAGAAAGLLVRRIGLRTGLLGAASLYALGSGICAVAPQMEVILAGRLLQGTGGGMLLALTYVALHRNFPAQAMPRLMALISATWSTSAFCGPLIGGTFSTFGLWRFGFWAFALQAVLFIACAFYVVPEQKSPAADDRNAGFPVLRLGVLTVAILLVAVAGVFVDAVVSPLMCIAGLVLIWLFLRIDQARPQSRMFPVGALNIQTTAGAGLFMVFTAAAATMSFMVYGPILLEVLYGVTPLAAGYIVALEAVSWGTAAILFSNHSHTSERWLIRTGTALVSLGVLGFAYAMPSGYLWTVLVCAAAQGAGFGMMWGFIVRRMIASVPAPERDVASSSIPTMQQVGFAIGAAAAGIVANAAGFADGTSSASVLSAAFWVFAAFVPLALLANLAAWKLSK